MCGFVGAMLQRTLEDSRLDAALASIRHRGPDATGRWVSDDGHWFLGHTRLSIIGLDNGAQPIANEAGDLQLVVNGEFYGYRAVREQLRSEGYRFQTDSDSEIALHLYHRDGMHLGKHLRGEFAALIADRKNRVMFAIRDRFGIKPLFYAVHEGSVYFASEVKALLALGVPARWDREAVLQEAYMVRPHSQSLFKGIYTVPPGHYAIAQKGEVTTYPYWDLDYPLAEDLAADARSDEEVVDGFREALEDAVRERLVADVEVASYLSGGIDSCAVLGMAQSMMDRPIRAYTLTFEDALFDESALAEKQAALCGSTYHPVPVTPRALADAYSDAVWHAETPFINGHGVAKYLLSRAVRDSGIKVVFTGEGADEMLGGYPPFRRDVLLYDSGSQDPEIVKRLLNEMRASNKAVPGFVPEEQNHPEVLDPVFRLLGFVPSWMQVFGLMGEETTDIFSRGMAESVAGMDPFAEAMGRLPVGAQMHGRNPLNQALYSWARIHLPNFVLTFLSDRMEMAHSIEGRVPFLDTKVAEFCAGVPIHMKIKGMREKHVLREAARDVIIDEVYNRQKHPFSTPPAKFGEDDAMLEFFGDTVESQGLDDQPIFDPAAVRALWKTFPDATPEERQMLDGFLNRVVSMTLMHERFGMTD
ncbi:MAG: asparagine synthase (glutamine-hydrolyzing) [bacterium]|nr:asparagine synthase (glutamine-hydrolyzing) [bacterium]